MKKLEKLTKECCLCRDWQDDKGKYYTPSPEDRRNAYSTHQQISHGMCDPCYILWEKRELGE